MTVSRAVREFRIANFRQGFDKPDRLVTAGKGSLSLVINEKLILGLTGGEMDDALESILVEIQITSEGTGLPRGGSNRTVHLSREP